MHLSKGRLQGVLWTLLAALAGVMAWAWARQPLGEGWAMVTASPWGWATLADLYAGLALVALWVFSVERSALRVLLWCTAFVLLGNLATLLYVILWLRRCAPGSVPR